jgi:hypothetical protein
MKDQQVTGNIGLYYENKGVRARVYTFDKQSKFVKSVGLTLVFS